MNWPPACLSEECALFKGLCLAVKAAKYEVAAEWVERARTMRPNFSFKGLCQFLPSDFVHGLLEGQADRTDQ